MNNSKVETHEEIQIELINVLADILQQISQKPYIDIIALNKC